MSQQKYAILALVLCVVAAVLYNSWPLGYVVNSPTAHYGLASDLELVGQPFYWLFTLGDILTGAVVVLVCAVLRLKLWPKSRPKSMEVVYIGLILFGVFTAVSALLPSQCTITPVLRCGADHGQGLGLDALISSIAALGLLISLAAVSWLGRGNKFGLVLTWMTQIVLLTWSLSGILFVVFALTNGQAHLLQQILLLLSGFALFIVGLNIYRAAEQSANGLGFQSKLPTVKAGAAVLSHGLPKTTPLTQSNTATKN